MVDSAFRIQVELVKRIQKNLLRYMKELLVPLHYGCVNKNEQKLLSKNF